MLVDLPRPMSRAWGAGKFFSVVRYADCVQISSISDEDFEKSMHVTTCSFQELKVALWPKVSGTTMKMLPVLMLTE